jgi:acetyltransferase-like isoleucine patch superfamily enzyme
MSIIVEIFSGVRREWQIRKDPVQYARSLGVQIGKNCRLLGLRGYTFGTEPWLVKLGDHVTITAGVRFITHDGGVWVFREKYPDIEVFGPILVGSNVFIGTSSMILPNVRIGDNCIIGAGAVVTRDIPANSVAVGIPARPIKTLEAYWKSVEKRAFFIRSQKPNEKRQILVKHFNL